MEYDLIPYLESLLGSGIKGYVLAKPENTPYPAFTVECKQRRGQSLYANAGKAFDYVIDLQVNVLGRKFSQVHTIQKTIVDHLDGFTGSLGSTQVIDCRLDEAAPLKNLSKNIEYVLMFTLRIS